MTSLRLIKDGCKWWSHQHGKAPRRQYVRPECSAGLLVSPDGLKASVRPLRTKGGPLLGALTETVFSFLPGSSGKALEPSRKHQEQLSFFQRADPYKPYISRELTTYYWFVGGITCSAGAKLSKRRNTVRVGEERRRPILVKSRFFRRCQSRGPKDRAPFASDCASLCGLA
jgi:hypothetical protein